MQKCIRNGGQMATRIIKVTGIAEWAKVFADNRDLTGWKASAQVEGTYEKYDGACTINMILDDASVAKLQTAGCAKGFKPDLEGRGQVVKFDRKFNTGYDWSSGAPIVTKEDGSTWHLDADGPIGNGSTVEVTLNIYDLPNYGTVGTRLESVHVLHHVQYVRPQETDELPPYTRKPELVSTTDEVMF